METGTLSAVLLVRIRAERDRRGWSQRELARRAGVPQYTVSRYEAGVRKLDLDVLEKLARAFGVPPARLLRQVKDD